MDVLDGDTGRIKREGNIGCIERGWIDGDTGNTGNGRRMRIVQYFVDNSYKKLVEWFKNTPQTIDNTGFPDLSTAFGHHE